MLHECGVRLYPGEKVHFELRSPVDPKLAALDEPGVVAVTVEGGSRGRSGWVTALNAGQVSVNFECGDDVAVVHVMVAEPAGLDPKGKRRMPLPPLGPERIEYPDDRGEVDTGVDVSLSAPIRDEQSGTPAVSGLFKM